MKQRVNVSRRVLKDGVESLYLDYYIAGKRVRENLKLYLHKENTASDRMKNSETMRIANAVRDKKEYELEQIDAGIEVKSKPNMVKFNEYATKKCAGLKQGTRANYLNYIKWVDDYKKDVFIQEMSYEFFAGFVSHLKSNGFASNTIRSTIGVVKSILHKAEQEGILLKTPQLINILPKSVTSIRNYLTIDEIRKIEKIKIKNDDVKNAFLFCCFTGLRWCDVSRLKPSMIVDDTIILRQQKTSEPVLIPLNDNAKKYLPEDYAKRSLIFPGCKSNAICNYNVGILCERADIDKHISFHCSRHTFATLLITYGADLYTTSKLLGHKSVNTTQIYAKMVDSARKKAVNLIPEL